ncbi:hypothetical protein ISCGN_022335 [Ixodes scapularis]
MPEEILPTPTGRSVCSEDQGTLSTSQMHLEGHWNVDVVVKEEPEEAYAPSTCEGSCSEAADTPFSYHDQLDGGLADNVVVKEEMEETLPASTGEGFCPEDNNEMSLSLLDLEGHCSGTRAVKKGKLNGGWSPHYFIVPSDRSCVSEKTNPLGSRRVKVIFILGGCTRLEEDILRKRQGLCLYWDLWTRGTSHHVVLMMQHVS